MPPDMLRSTNWLSMVGGVIVAPSRPTCNGATYDFFVVAEGLVPAVAAVLRIDDAGLYPHWPARLVLSGDARRHWVRRLVRPPRIHATIPHGPLPEPQEVFHGGVANNSVSIADGAVQWLAAAQREWGSLTGAAVGVQRSGPEFKWKPAVGLLTRAQCVAISASAFWHILAARFEECAALLTRVGEVDARYITTHIRKALLLTARWIGDDNVESVEVQPPRPFVQFNGHLLHLHDVV